MSVSVLEGVDLFATDVLVDGRHDLHDVIVRRHGYKLKTVKLCSRLTES